MAVEAFRFGGTGELALKALTRFTDEAAKWKPPDYDRQMRLRLDYYTDRQEEDVRAALQKMYPKTGQEMAAWTQPLTQHIVDEQSRVFLDGTKLDLVDDKGAPVKDDVPFVDEWKRIVEENRLPFLLKQIDRYTNLHGLGILKPSWDALNERVSVGVFFPHHASAVMDPAYPVDPDQARGVLLEVGSEAGVYGGAKATDRRFEFWCARKGEEQYRIIHGDGSVETIEGNDAGTNPFVDDKGRALVPLVFFLGHGDELGLFSLAGQGLHLFNRAVNLFETDIHHIAKHQGFGHTWFTTKGGFEPPREIEMSPARGNPLPEGADVKVTNGNPILAELETMLSSDIKRAAVLRHIPPGSVAQDARSASSGYALQIERQPLIEARKDRIDLYKSSMHRLWRVVKTVHNTYAEDAKKFPPEVQLHWTPGEIEVPVDPQIQQDLDLIDIANDLTTLRQVVARKYGLTAEQAKEKLDAMQKENDETRGRLVANAELQGGAVPGRGALAGYRANEARQKLGATPGQQSGVTPQPQPPPLPLPKK